MVVSKKNFDNLLGQQIKRLLERQMNKGVLASGGPTWGGGGGGGLSQRGSCCGGQRFGVRLRLSGETALSGATTLGGYNSVNNQAGAIPIVWQTN